MRFHWRAKDDRRWVEADEGLRAEDKDPPRRYGQFFSDVSWREGYLAADPQLTQHGTQEVDAAAKFRLTASRE